MIALKNIKLLIIDDLKSIRFLLKEVFTENGYTVFDAASIETALKIIDKQKPKVALVDMRLGSCSQENGADAVSILKQCSPNMKIVIITGLCKGVEIEKALQSGATCCIEKPFDVEEIIGTVEECLKQK